MNGMLFVYKNANKNTNKKKNGTCCTDTRLAG